MSKVRCAVIGLGRLGYWHAENLSLNIPDAELVYVVAPRSHIAERVARDVGAEKWSTNPMDAIEDPSIDAIIIATPANTHTDLIKRVIANGKHIFIEKPITQNISEAKDIVQLIQETKLFCQVGFMRRYDPAYAQAKKRIEAGDIGRPIYFKGVSRDPESPTPEYIKNSGGMFVDLSIHDYDIARFLMNSEVKSVMAHGCILKNLFMEEFNDVDQSITYLTFESGAAGDIEGSRNAYYGYDIRGEVIGTEGTIQIGSLINYDIKILNKKGGTHDIVPDFSTRFRGSFILEMTDFINSIKNNIKPKVNEVDGMIALEIALKAKESFDTNQVIQL